MVKRNLFLYKEIDAETVGNITEEILSINDYDDVQESQLLEYNRAPIYLYINSPGGVCYDGFALMDIMQTSRTPIITVAIGKCMSMGLLIFLMGHQRYAAKNVTFMYHSVAGHIADKIAGMRQEINELPRVNDVCSNLITQKTKIKKAKLQGYIDSKSDWYFNASDAITMGVAQSFYKGNI